MTSPAPAAYCRVQAWYRGRLGVEVGVFVAVDHLRRAGELTPNEVGGYLDIDDWFRLHLPEPDFYRDGNSIGAVTWFKAPIPPQMWRRTRSLMAILAGHDVDHELVFSDDPGTVVYADDFQIGVIPHVRGAQTPMPPGVRLGPTTSGSKRDLPHGPVAESKKVGADDPAPT